MKGGTLLKNVPSKKSALGKRTDEKITCRGGQTRDI